MGFKHPDSYSRIAQARFQMLNNRVGWHVGLTKLRIITLENNIGFKCLQKETASL